MTKIKRQRGILTHACLRGVIWCFPLFATGQIWPQALFAAEPLEAGAPPTPAQETLEKEKADLSAQGGLQPKSTTEKSQEREITSKLDQPQFKVPNLKVESIMIPDTNRMTHREDRIGFNQPVGDYGLKNYGVELTQITGYASFLHYQGYKLWNSMELQPNDHWNFFASLGIGELTLQDTDNQWYGSSRILPLGHGKLTYTPIRGTDLRFDSCNDFAFQGWVDPYHISRVMPSQSYLVEAETFSIPKWQLRTNAKWIYFADSNRQDAYDETVLRDIWTDPFIFRFGVGGGWFSFHNQMPNYWSPMHVEYYGIRAIAIKDFAKYWNYELRYTYNLQRVEHDLLRPFTSTEMHLRFHTQKDFRVSLHATFDDTDRGGWWKDTLGITLETPI